MTENTSRSRNISFEQLKSLIDFMGQHIEFATGNCRSLEARHASKSLWDELTKTLNNSRTGTKKTSDGWSKYWSDFKNKLKNKVSILNKRQRSTSVSKKGITPLSKLEKRALVILGPYFERKKARRKCEFSNNAMSSQMPPEIKLEAYQDDVFSDFSKAQSDTSDRLSDGDRVEECMDINNEFDEDSDQNSNEPLIQSLYPKWLIQVEKKRAEAELIRAKAEEHRASVAAKSAEAMLLQAEALKHISEAAMTQAEAITRIAIALEKRNRDNMSI
ncbi:PREDICTED: uncharacterized protein LOC106117035 isoform X2 [Papilio xuthus]|uniref:Regulatory protein zeste n=1 Tax=Papilio xuthus TaxID=66420 RepID=A0A194PPV5_PAPXU|nr:PREDICTED: uncharacterized protein LOC106117035 isoform X2 [Papilio xuthus]KPI95347.1 hypothetical protein RR46_08806 [Papilio xuthus]